LILIVAGYLLAGGCALLVKDYDDDHFYGYCCPEKIYPHYKQELQVYAERLDAGVVHESVPNRGYDLPQCLIDNGARYCNKFGNCYCITFESLLDNPVPELWYSPTGFTDVPQIVSEVKHLKARWQKLDTNWACCYRP
jgi:hypothetical protein